MWLLCFPRRENLPCCDCNMGQSRLQGTHARTCARARTHTHTHTLSLSLTHTLSLSLTHTLSLSLSHTHTHAHAHTKPGFLAPSSKPCHNRLRHRRGSRSLSLLVCPSPLSPPCEWCEYYPDGRNIALMHARINTCVSPTSLIIVQELCESRGGRPGLSVLTSLLVSVDVKIY